MPKQERLVSKQVSNNTVNTRENIYDTTGMGKVYKFTLKQTFKNKSYIFSFILFVIIMCCLKPINYFTSKGGQASVESVNNVSNTGAEHVYVLDKTDIGLDLMYINTMAFRTESGESTTTVSISDKSEEELVKSLTPKDIAVIITFEDNAYKVKGVISEGSEIAVSDLDNVTDFIKQSFADTRTVKAGVTEDDLNILQKGISINSTETQESFEAKNSGSVPQSTFMMFLITFSVFGFLATSMSTSYIIASVTEEKQSKLVESLLVTVRPMALLLGKVLAMMTYVLLLLLTGIIASFIVDFIMFDIMKLETEGISTGGINFQVFTEFGIPGAISMVFTVVLTYLICSILSGMLGSACSKPEDVQSATGTVMMFAMVGYMGAVMVGGIDNPTLNLVAALVPPLSMYSLPIIYFCERVDLVFFILSYVIQIVLLLLMVRLMAKTYRNLLLADSSTPKLKTIFKATKG